MKVTYSTDNISSFGGINFADHLIKDASLYELIDQELGIRSLNSTYKYSDLVRSYLLMVLCGGDCAEDITENLKKELNHIEGFKTCSADTLLRMQKELATEKQIYISDSQVEHEFNVNLKLNSLLVKMLVSTGQLNSDNQDYIFDYDNQFIPTQKYDSKRSYKKADGYFPGIATIDNHPVYIENRNGNSNVKYKQADTLKNAYQTLTDFNIRPKRSRMDCGSFTKEVISVVEECSDLFYIRAQRCADLYQKIKEVDSWQEVEIGYKKYQITSIEYAPFGQDKQYRYVITREQKQDRQGDLFTGDDFKYRAIITNDKVMKDLLVVEFYNARGNSERLFDEMNNDFLWSKMPFSFLQENTVFLLIMAICRNMYHYLVDRVSKTLGFIKPNFRLKKFIYRFIVVPVKWISRGSQRILKLFSSKEYHLLLE